MTSTHIHPIETAHATLVSYDSVTTVVDPDGNLRLQEI
ncbi:hypothetical protein PS862_00387 [Pseudomonas fluorescens]|uniref:Uncharacterized protein n=1 Tax=Pseudomonas fluorescens TaxID=294 RepID=A0A5E7GLB2_PSEFL|nr:hypothetical protein PS862_00387 [Pseudomonas fluorescens]